MTGALSGLGLPTVSDLLDLASLRRAEPQVLNARDRLNAPVRWVTITELPDVGRHLRGGELVLTTGASLPSDRAGATAYMDGLAGVGISGLVIDQGARPWPLPPEISHAASDCGVPLIVLQRPVNFLEVTEAAHRLIVESQAKQLRLSDAAHVTFTALTLDGAPADLIVEEAARLAGCAVVLQAVNGEVLAFGGWSHVRSAGSWPTATAGSLPGESLTTVPVGAGDDTWGRLLAEGASADNPHLKVILEEAAVALAIEKLLDRKQGVARHHSHRSLISDIKERPHAEAISVRAQVLGVPLSGRRLIGLTVWVPELVTDDALATEARKEAVVGRVSQAVRSSRHPALVAALTDRSVTVLLSVPREANPDRAVAVLSSSIWSSLDAAPASGGRSIGVGRPVLTVAEAGNSIIESERVAVVAARTGEPRSFFSFSDVRIRGLIHDLRDEPWMRRFVEREIGPLSQYEEAKHTGLIECLRAYLDCSGNKSKAAASVHLSRPAYYQRLDLISRLLDADLSDVPTAMSLYVALLALEDDEER